MASKRRGNPKPEEPEEIVLSPDDDDDDKPTQFDRIKPPMRELSDFEKRLLDGCKKPPRRKFVVPSLKKANSQTKPPPPIKKAASVVNQSECDDGGDLPELDDPVSLPAILNDFNAKEEDEPSSSGDNSSRTRPKPKGSENKNQSNTQPQQTQSKKAPPARSKTTGPAVAVVSNKVAVKQSSGKQQQNNKSTKNEAAVGRKRGAIEAQNATSKRMKNVKKLSPGEEDLRALQEAIEKTASLASNPSTRAKRSK